MGNFLCHAVFLPDVSGVAVVLKLRLKLSWNKLECFKERQQFRGKGFKRGNKDLKGVIKMFTKFQTSNYLAKNNVGYVTNPKHN